MSNTKTHFLSKNRVYIYDGSNWKANPAFDSPIKCAVYTDKTARKMMLSHLYNFEETDYKGAFRVARNINYKGKNGKIVFELEDGRIGKSSIITNIKYFK